MVALIKRTCELKPKSTVVIMCVILVCFSCKKEEKPIGTPDKVIENITGSLWYYEELKMWTVRYHIQGTIDAAEEYLFSGMPQTFKEGRQVTISGYCYEIPKYIIIKSGVDMFGGTTYYYIKITDLNKREPMK